MTSKEILYQETQSFDVNKSVHSTITLIRTLLKPEGEANPHIQFVYNHHTIFNNTRVHVSESMNADLTKKIKQVNNQQRLYQN